MTVNFNSDPNVGSYPDISGSPDELLSSMGSDETLSTEDSQEYIADELSYIAVKVGQALQKGEDEESNDDDDDRSISSNSPPSPINMVTQTYQKGV